MIDSDCPQRLRSHIEKRTMGDSCEDMIDWLQAQSNIATLRVTAAVGTKGSSRVRAGNAADGIVGLVPVGSRTVVRGIPLALERVGGFVLPLAAGAVDVSLGAPDTLGPTREGDRVTPFVHTP